MKLNLGPILLGITTLILLNGCVKSTQIRPDQEVVKEKGIILASVTTSSNYDVWFYFKKKDSTNEQRMDAVGSVFLFIKDDYEKIDGRMGILSAFEVEPGQYYLTRWNIYISTGTANYYYIGPKRGEGLPIPFTVKAGEITYLGNLHADTLYVENIFGFKIPISGKPSIKNNEVFDLQLLKKKYLKWSNNNAVNYSL